MVHCVDGFKDITDTYEITGEIGSGGGGTVYKAYHKRLKKDVVIKKIHNDVKDIVNSRAEADILKNLRHSYLPQVFDFLEINGNVYTVMDFIPGKSFQQLLDEGVRFKQKQIIKWARQLAEALVYLHGQTPPILHSDIKPANIMLTPQGDICLIDFNISSVFSNGKAAPIGYSDGYSPPEQYPQLTTGKNRQPELRQSEAGMQSDPVKRHKPGSSNKIEEPIMHISASEDRNKDETEYFDRSEGDEDRTEECLRLTDSYNIMNRAYIMCSKTYEKAGDKIEDADAKNINLLEEASVKLPVDLRLMVNTRLAEAYVRQGTLSGDNEYYRKAVDLFTDCIRMGWDNYNIRNSLSMLFYMTGEYVMAYDELNYMLEKYGENYNTYKRLAYLEADVQSSKANEDRDYTIFREYYKKASELYHKDKKNDKGDAEMDFLDGIYREMLEGRWFDE